MRVAFRQTGGVAGLRLGCELDTAELSRAEARRLEALVRASGLRAGQARGSENARDLTRYEVVVESDDGVVRASFDDACVPTAAEPLLEFLRARARVERA